MSIPSGSPNWNAAYTAPEPLKQVVAWAETYRAFWDASFDRLDVYLQELHAQRRKEVRECPIARPHPAQATFRQAGAILSATFRTGSAPG